MSPSSTRLRLRIEGHVQGVFFRQSTQAKAQELGLGGFVQNLPDGSVLAEVEGSPDAVDNLVQWSQRGPPAARVTRVQVTPVAPLGVGLAFTIQR